MATNDFKPFAVSSNANVTTQSDYEALTALVSGFQAGKASSAQVNKALRQSTSIAALLGNFISKADLDAIDDGDQSTLLKNFISALSINLSLGGASKRNVGSSSGNIPDMSLFPFTFNSSATNKLSMALPNGFIIKASFGTSDSNGWFSIPFDTPFPNGLIVAWATERAPNSNADQTSTVNVNQNYSSKALIAGQMRSVTSSGVGVLSGALTVFAIGY